MRREKGHRMICYHSTKKENVESILTNGFKRSIDGEFGAVLYLSLNKDFSKFYGDALIICEIDDSNITNIYLSELDKIKRINTFEVYKDKDIKCMNVLLRNDKSFEVIVFDVNVVRVLDIQYKAKVQIIN